LPAAPAPEEEDTQLALAAVVFAQVVFALVAFGPAASTAA
jgi:hypothetical protein